MEKMSFETSDMVLQNIEKIAEIFPSVITEMHDEDGKLKKGINFEMLKQLLSPDVVDGAECYEFTWVGKKAAMAEAARPITKTLRPVKEDSRDWETTENLYLEGDNLEVLKILQESYLGKVKMIYIDPPYNTGKDFVYPDRFMMDDEEYREKTNYFDEGGNVNYARVNSESEEKYHSDWCSMIYSRMRLARNLLSEDGMIFISIDDNEAENLVKIMDEIFGRRNRIAIICHKARASVSNDKIISSNHNFILFYAKEILVIEEIRNMIGMDPDLEGFNLNDNDNRGPYRLVPVDGPGGEKKGNPYYVFLGVKGYWRFSKATMEKKYNQGLIVKKGNGLYQKYYLSAAKENRKTVTTWWDNAGYTSSATKKLKQLMNQGTFDAPKPVELVIRMLKMVTFSNNNSIILDFFSGSATTAHAVMQLNAEDGGHRKFIMVQLPEPCGEKTEAYKAGYKNICEIGKERIRRAGDKIKSEHPDADLDIGFRVFRVDESNMKDVYYHPETVQQQDLFEQVSNIKEDRTDMDLLYACLLDWGVEIHLPHTQEVVEGCTVHDVDGGALMACFDEKVPVAVVEYMAKKQPLRVVFRDNAFGSDAEKINVTEIFKNISPDTKVKVL